MFIHCCDFAPLFRSSLIEHWILTEKAVMAGNTDFCVVVTTYLLKSSGKILTAPQTLMSRCVCLRM